MLLLKVCAIKATNTNNAKACLYVKLFPKIECKIRMDNLYWFTIYRKKIL